MAKKVEAVLGCDPKEPDTVIDRGDEVSVNLNGAAPYTTPVPPLLTLNTALATAKSARTAWGTRDNHGTTAQKIAYKAAIAALFAIIKQLCRYVNLTTPEDAVLLSTTGFPLSIEPGKLPLMNPPQNLRRIIAKNIGLEKAKMDWEKPSNAKKGQVITFNLMRNTTPDFTTSLSVAETHKTTFIDVPEVTVPTTFYYWVVAISPAGISEPSDVCRVQIVPLSA